MEIVVGYIDWEMEFVSFEKFFLNNCRVTINVKTYQYFIVE